MASLLLFDLDLEENISKLYTDAKDTIKYLEDMVKSIEAQVIGETFTKKELEGFKIVEKPGNRYITPPGEKYLAKTLGEDKFYEIIKKPLTLGKLEGELNSQEMNDLILSGYIAYRPSKKVVEVV